MTKIVTVAQMKAIEAAADAKGHSYAEMMEFAGMAVADHIIQRVLSSNLEPEFLIIVGPGNNGGDGLTAARYLATFFIETPINIYMLRKRNDRVFKTVQDLPQIEFFYSSEDPDFEILDELVKDCTILIDALLGTGIELPLRKNAKALLKAVNTSLSTFHKPSGPSKPLTLPHPTLTPPLCVAVDCPSGLDCDTGAISEDTIKADVTITFAALKYGQLRFPGSDTVGELVLGTIGLPPGIAEIENITVELASPAGRMPKRAANSHKGTHGKMMLMAGSEHFIGAAYLAGMGAYRVGAGLVTIVTPPATMALLASTFHEATWLPLAHDITQVHTLQNKLAEGYNSLVIGPGIGQHENSRQFLLSLFEEQDRHPLPHTVLDADALNILANVEAWWAKLPAQSIITPHPAEFGRLAGIATADVQANRLENAQNYASQWGCIVVLKGAHTIIAAPEGRAWISPIASGALATAGTGDVLAGAIGGLLAQGLSPADAAICGVWLHGMSGLILEQETGTTRGIVARDVLNMMTSAILLAENL